jgi:DNA repair protein SbcD/Mre11
MRLLHTADWHVGRTLRGRSRAEEHEAVLDELVGIADDGGVDLVVVAGDLFDTAAPTPEAERLVYRTLLRLAERDRQVVIIAGNHDHPRRLSAVEPLLDLARVRVRPVVAAPAEGGVVDLDVAGTPTRLALLPWLSHRHAVSADDLLSRDADQHNQTYLDRMRRIAGALCAAFGGDTANLAVGHLTAVGGLLGGGERTAHTVFDYAVPATVFPPTTSYVALGHLHRNQRLDAAAPTWYSGSPLQLDFGEGDNTPAVQLVELHPGRPARTETVPVTAGRRLRTVTGSLTELDALVDPGAGDHLRLVVRERLRAGLADEVRERFPHAVEVRIELEDPTAGTGRAADPGNGGRSGRTPSELFAGYLADQDIDDPRVARLFDRLLGEDDDAA